jgi:hypothetical protein
MHVTNLAAGNFLNNLIGCISWHALRGDLLVVHQRKCTLGKMETSSRLVSDEITNLWVKLCNLCRV